MSLLNTRTVMCPYCFQRIELVIDCSVARQEYVEDCPVCCRPIVVNVYVEDDGQITLDARSEVE